MGREKNLKSGTEGRISEERREEMNWNEIFENAVGAGCGEDDELGSIRL